MRSIRSLRCIRNAKDPTPTDIPSEVDAGRRRIMAERGQVGFTVPGSLTTNTVTREKPSCRSLPMPTRRNGPYIQWSRIVKGRTVN